MAIDFFLNGLHKIFEGNPDTPLLWVIRESFDLTGTKFGCGMALCGACTVHMNGVPIRSCVKRVRDVQGAQIKTIEGLGQNGELHPVQKAWAELNVPQCGYCQSGQIMSAVALLDSLKAQARQPTNEDINIAMSGNLCRCGTYPRICAAIKKVAKEQE